MVSYDVHLTTVYVPFNVLLKTSDDKERKQTLLLCTYYSNCDMLCNIPCCNLKCLVSPKRLGIKYVLLCCIFVYLIVFDI